MNIRLSDRVQCIKPSPTLAVSARAQALRAEGIDIIDLGVGEPDFDTPQFIKNAAIQALADGYTKYTAVDGLPSLKKAIVQKFAKENNLQYEPNQVLVSCGGKQSFFNLIQAFINEGDEVIIPAPYWVSYPDIVLLAGGKPVVLETNMADQFKITPAQLEQAITAKTKLFVINSPSNPSGLAYTSEELAALGKVLLKHPHVLVATDDMYEHMLWNHMPFRNILMVTPELYDRTMVLNGVSKAYAMTGWRIGYCAGPKALIQAMTKIQGQSTSNPTAISQKAAEAALSGPQDSIQHMLEAFKTRHDFVYKALNQIPGIQCLPSDGTFYTFPDMHALIGKTSNVTNDVQLAEFFLTQAQVAMVPGSAFGTPGFMRMSFATSMEKLEKAIERIEKAVMLLV